MRPTVQNEDKEEAIPMPHTPSTPQALEIFLETRREERARTPHPDPTTSQLTVEDLQRIFTAKDDAHTHVSIPPYVNEEAIRKSA